MPLRTLAVLWICLAPFASSAGELVLANGDTLRGEIVEWAVDYVVIDHPQLGRVTLTLDQLALDTGKPPNPGLFGSGFVRGWDRRIHLGINGEQGDGGSLNVTAGIDFGYQDDWSRWKINGRYLFQDSEGEDDDSNNSRLDLRRDWLDPDSRWFRRLLGRHQFDDFESWKHRLTLFGGPGYHAFDTPTHKLDVAVGPGFSREFGDSQANRGLAGLSLDYSWFVTEFLEFHATNTLFLEFAPDAGSLQNLSRLVWTVALTDRPGLSLNLTLENEYDSNPEPDDQANDLKYFLTLGLDL